MEIGKFVRRWGIVFLIGLVMLFFNTYFTAKIPTVIGMAVDMLAADAPVKDEVTVLVRELVILAVGALVCAVVWRLLVFGTSRKFEVYIRKKLYGRLQILPVSFFRTRKTGDLMAYAVGDIGAMRMLFGPVIVMSFNTLSTVIVAVIEMVKAVDVRLTLLALVPIPVAFVSTTVLGKIVHKRSLRVQKLFAGLSGYVNESISGIKVIKSFAVEKEREDTFDSLSAEMKEANVSLVKASSAIAPLVGIAFGLSYALAVIFGGNAVLSGKIGAGTFVAYLGLLTIVQNPVMHIGTIVERIQRGKAAYSRLREVFDAEVCPEPDEASSKHIDTSAAPEITVRGLSYRYPDADENEADALCGIDFTVRSGGSLGICGPTGCGKTTVLGLISKLLFPERGQIFVNGADVTDIGTSELRSFMGYVPQDGFLFSASISENVALGCDIDAERVRSCAEVACICREIEEFPDGFETEVGERGTHLSGGQKQRVSLARALYREPKLLLLDDTLSAVDNITERRLVENLGLDGSRRGDATVIVVSHRLSALEHCDEIIYMENGKISERGTHAELIRLGGAYAEAYKKQAEEAECDE